MRSEIREIQAQVEARTDRLTEVDDQLSSLRVELSAAKTVPMVGRVSSAPADTECMTCDNDDDTALRDSGVQAPRNRTLSRSGMPCSALEVEGWHGDVMGNGGNRFDTAEAASSLHTVPIGQSVPVSEHDTHQTHSSIYPISTQFLSRRGD